MCSQPRIVGNNRQELLVVKCCEKDHDVTGEGDHAEIGHHFFESNILALASGDKYKKVQCDGSTEVKKQAWTVGQRMTQ